jgi:hypothetical protein
LPKQQQWAVLVLEYLVTYTAVGLRGGLVSLGGVIEHAEHQAVEWCALRRWVAVSTGGGLQEKKRRKQPLL